MERRRPGAAERHRIISDLTSDCAYAFRVRADGRAAAEWVNDAFRRVTGYTAEDIAAEGGWLFMVHADDLPAARRHARRLLAGEPDVSEHRIVTRSGEVRWLRSSARPVHDGTSVVRIYGTARDITEERRAAEERERLLASEQEARAAAEAASRRFAFLAEANRLLTSSLDYETTLITLADLAIASLADWCTVHLVDADGVLRTKIVAHADPAKRAWARRTMERHPEPPANALRVLASGRSELVAEIPADRLAAIARDEEHLAILRSFRSALCVALVARGRTLGTLSFVAAESGRTYGTAELTLAEDLARRAALAVDNARLYRDAQDADRRKDQFLAMLGHELRNPLAAISAATEVLDRVGSHDDLPTRQRAIIARQTRHLAHLVKDLLDVSRIASGKITLVRRPLDLNAVVQQCVQSLVSCDATGGRRLSSMLAPERVVVDGDAVRLEQVVTNLLDNAVKYTPADGRIAVTVSVEGAEAAIRVEDTGIGIAPDALGSIFEPFTQVTSTLDRTEGGLGLGLTLVRSLVEQHGGRVTARSAGPGCGSEFVVHLPLGGAAEPVADCRPAEGARPSRHVLLVEDNADTRESMRVLLEVVGHRVDVESDGTRGLEKALSRPPDVGLIDIGLPGLDGYQLARRVRAAPGGDGVLLIALTGYGQPDDEQRALDAGFDAHLVKPVDPERLLRLLTIGRGS